MPNHIHASEEEKRELSCISQELGSARLVALVEATCPSPRPGFGVGPIGLLSSRGFGFRPIVQIRRVRCIFKPRIRSPHTSAPTRRLTRGVFSLIIEQTIVRLRRDWFLPGLSPIW